MTRRYTGLIAVALAVATTAGSQEPNAVAVLAQRLVTAASAPPGRPDRPAERTALERLYERNAPPRWSMDGSPTRQALHAMNLLGTVETRGLAPSDYAVDSLLALAGTLSSVSTSPADAARFDVALSRAVIRLLADLHMGRVDPRALRFDLPDTHEQLDLAALAAEVAQSPDVAATIAAAEPPYAGYVALKGTLARYRRLAADTGLRPPARTSRTIRPGDAYEGAPVLRRWLGALGDPGDSTPGGPASARPVPSDISTYDSALMTAVVRFQRRHGLEPDGVIGPATMAQLRTPLARRVRQIELALERWRWLPDRAPARYAVVNVPAFRLYIFESDSTAERPVLTMNVIVGQAQGRHGTPVFVGTMREVVFRPYWDVPPRIARNELIPQFRRRPSSFVNEEFEIVRVGDAGDDATRYPPTAENFRRVADGTLRLRQRPGAQNALGAVKFVFPNPYNVFMHGTPAPQLFEYSRRDFSHGCIRIEEPAALAELVLRGQGTWDTAAIDSAMHGTRTIHVPIARPMAVYVLYATAAIDDAGVPHFYSDLYGHDAALERVLGLPAIDAGGATGR